MGSILGDFVKGRDFELYSPAIRDGILLHRHIDGFTDRHAVNHDLRLLFPAPLRRYRGICLDLFWDYCLSMAWDKYYHQPKKQFVQSHYATLRNELQNLQINGSPEAQYRASAVISRMIGHDWLSSYQEVSNVTTALQRIGQRLQRPVALDGAVNVLLKNEQFIQDRFEIFFPDVISFSKVTAREIKSVN